MVLRRWERSEQKFGFIKRVDKGCITTVKDLEDISNINNYHAEYIRNLVLYTRSSFVNWQSNQTDGVPKRDVFL